MKLDILKLLEDCGAMLEGHFRLTSGLHSDRYIEKFRLLEQPRALRQAAEAMIDGLDPAAVEVVLGAAIGGILLAGSVSALLDRRTMFTERVEGEMTLRRGFNLRPGEKVLIVEDIVTTGGSVEELLKVVRAAGAEPLKVVCLVDRSSAGLSLDLPTLTLLRLPIAAWPPDACPLCREGRPLQEPGRSGKIAG